MVLQKESNFFPAKILNTASSLPIIDKIVMNCFVHVLNLKHRAVIDELNRLNLDSIAQSDKNVANIVVLIDSLCLFPQSINLILQIILLARVILKILFATHEKGLQFVL